MGMRGQSSGDNLKIEYGKVVCDMSTNAATVKLPKTLQQNKEKMHGGCQNIALAAWHKRNIRIETGLIDEVKDSLNWVIIMFWL